MMADKPFAWLFVCLMWTGPVWGMAAVTRVECPLQVKATVQDVQDTISSESPMAMQRVHFTVDESLKGDSGNELEIDILKHGPNHAEIGKQYIVHVNDGKLCSLDLI